MKKIILNLFDRLLHSMEIRKEEAPKVFILLGLCIPMGLSMVLAYSVTNSVFNTEVGPDYLPYMYLVIGLLQLPLLFGLNNFVNKKNIYRSTKTTLIISMIIILVNWILFEQNDFSKSSGVLLKNIIIAFIFISTFISIYLVNFLIWIIASEMFTIRESKRLLAHLSGGYYIGVVVGGLALSAVIGYIGINWIYFSTIIFLGIAVYLLNLLNEKYMKILIDGAEHEKITVSESYSYLKDSKYSKLVIFLFIMFNLLRCFFLFQFNIAAEYKYPDTADLTQYFGFYESLNAAVSIIITFFFINKIILYLGVWNTMILLGSGFTATFFIVMTKDVNIYLLSIGALLNECLYYLVMPPLHTLVFKPVNLRIRTAIMSMSNLISESLGQILSFVFGLLITWKILDFFDFSVFSIVISLIISLILIYSKKEYIKILSEAIKSKNTDIFEHSNELFGSIQKSINSSFIQEIFKSSDPDVIKTSLQFIQNIKNPEIIKFLMPLLNSPDSEIKAHAIGALGNFDNLDENIIENIHNMFDDTNYKVRANAIIVLNRKGIDKFNSQAEVILEEMIGSDSIERKIVAIETISVIKLPKLQQKILDFIKDDNFSIRKSAITAVSLIYNYIPQKDYEQVISNLVELLNEPDDVIRSEAVNTLSVIGKNNIDLFAKMLTSKNVLEWESAVELLARWQSNDNYDYMVSSALIHIKEIFENIISMRELKKIPFSDAVEPLLNRLENNNEIIMRVIFRIFSIKSDRTIINTLKIQLYNSDKNIRMNAIETLENVADQKIVKGIIPVFEFTEQSEIIEAAKKLWKLEEVKYQKTLIDLLHDNDPWARACSAYIMGELSHNDFEKPLKNYLDTYNQKLSSIKSETNSERSEQKLQNFINENFLVCENIKIALQNIETLKKLLFEEDFIMPEKSDLLPLMERIIFLKKIPIFSR
ncbi:HEAT repeat domain-containing protein, partial [Candidatus Dependentiae bacterium]|nr:HEAT repeat domain-containing protein [Candidatus Dependentiae bacterium]